VLKLFSKTKDKQVLGARVLSGSIDEGAQVRIMRDEVEVGRGKVTGLQESKMQTNSVKEDSEFGGEIQTKSEIQPSDILEAVVTVTK
jgi:translation initiation factor IF-2